MGTFLFNELLQKYNTIYDKVSNQFEDIEVTDFYDIDIEVRSF